jgi:hypothetical protein
MSIQRWTMRGATRHGGGDFVTYSDHVEALRQAVEEARAAEREDARVRQDEALAEVRKRNADNMLAEFTNFWQQGYEQGQRDALAGLEGKAVQSAIALARRQALEGAVQRVEAEQQRAGDINFCKDCADWAVAAIKGGAE